MKVKLLKYFMVIMVLIIIPLWHWNEYHNYLNFLNWKAPVFPYDDLSTVAKGISALTFYLIIACTYFSIKLINEESKIEEALKAINNAKQKE